MNTSHRFNITKIYPDFIEIQLSDTKLLPNTFLQTSAGILLLVKKNIGQGKYIALPVGQDEDVNKLSKETRLEPVIIIAAQSAIKRQTNDSYSILANLKGTSPKDQVENPVPLKSPDFKEIVIPNKGISTGIASIDAFLPLLRGGKTAIIGDRQTGKTTLLFDFLKFIYKQYGSTSSFFFSSFGIKPNEIKSTIQQIEEINESSGHQDKICFHYTLDDQSHGIKETNLLSHWDTAQFNRDEKTKETFLFFDDFHYFLMANQMNKALISHSAIFNYLYYTQLTNELRIIEGLNSTLNASITSVFAIYIPDDQRDSKLLSALSSHFDTVVFLSQKAFRMGYYPAVDIYSSFSTGIRKDIMDQSSYAAALKQREVLEKYRTIKEVIRFLDKQDLSEEDQTVFKQAIQISKKYSLLI